MPSLIYYIHCPYKTWFEWCFIIEHSIASLTIFFWLYQTSLLSISSIIRGRNRNGHRQASTTGFGRQRADTEHCSLLLWSRQIYDQLKLTAVKFRGRNLASLLITMGWSYASLTDAWCPVSYGDNLQEILSDTKRVHFDTHNSDHAFVLGFSDLIAEECTKMLRDDWAVCVCI
jgi:hypothetical protein